MPVGGNLLLKYGGLPEPPTPDPATPRRAWRWFGIGLLILIAVSLWANAHPPTGRYALGAYSIAVAGAFAINRLHAGWQEDGLLGMIWTWKHPVGWEFMGERRSPLIALWLILAVLSVLTASAINKTWP